MDAFRSAYALFTPDNEMMLDEMLSGCADLTFGRRIGA